MVWKVEREMREECKKRCLSKSEQRNETRQGGNLSESTAQPGTPEGKRLPPEDVVV